MNYYERHLGDYARDTKWLTTYQHGVYTLLLDWYYTNERAIPTDILYRIVAARSGPERKAVDEVVSAFFDLTKEAGFAYNKRAEFVVAKYRIKQSANSLKAKQRWDATSMPAAMPQQCQDDASQKPVTSNQEPEDQKPPVVPVGDIPADVALVIDLYHQILPGCQHMSAVTPKRIKRIREAGRLAKIVCKQQNWPYDPVEFWGAYFVECSGDAWMRGEVPNPKNPKWRQNLDVLLKEDRFATVMDQAIAAMRMSE